MKIYAPHKVPISLRDKVKAHLDQMVKEDVIDSPGYKPINHHYHQEQKLISGIVIEIQ